MYEYNNQELVIDVVAATALPCDDLSDKISPFCLISWNGKVVGQTAVVVRSCSPLWEKQRFTLRIPVLDDVENALEMCKLRIDVYDRRGTGKNLLGTAVLLVTVAGAAVDSPIRNLFGTRANRSKDSVNTNSNSVIMSDESIACN